MYNDKISCTLNCRHTHIRTEECNTIKRVICLYLVLLSLSIVNVRLWHCNNVPYAYGVPFVSKFKCVCVCVWGGGGGGAMFIF